MIDFHSHILPGMDDGSSSPEESLAMLEMSAEQGVDHIFATSHFYADEEDPSSFLRRREQAVEELNAYLQEKKRGSILPQIHLGAEVYYFPGISDCEEIIPLALGDTGMILVEPPVMPFSTSMLDEIEEINEKLRLVPVMAHLDRYCRMLRDDSLFARMAQRRILVQVNASFFLHQDSAPFAMEMLKRGMFQLIGSDCHNMTNRLPNIGLAAAKIRENNLQKSLAFISENGYNVLTLR
ncbi:MAG: hypothetical protein IJ237_04335 [Oscillospiraceae bacterium]|nr:hypothetical protein [Oscillospiraceae bacterium]